MTPAYACPGQDARCAGDLTRPSNIPLCPMAPLHSFLLAVSSPLFCPASLPSNRVIPTLSLVHWPYPTPVAPSSTTSTMTEHAPSFVNAMSHWTSRGCHHALDIFQKFNVLALCARHHTLHPSRSAVHCVLSSDVFARSKRCSPQRS
jgi:hypothetical protein